MTKYSPALVWENNPIITNSIQATAFLKDNKTYWHCYCINKLSDKDYQLHVTYFGSPPKHTMPNTHHKTLDEAKALANQHYLNFLNKPE